MSTPREMAADFRSARLRLLQTADWAPRETVAVRPDAQSWSVLEVVAHLAPVDADYGNQALEVIRGDRTQFRYFDDDAWKAAHPGILEWPWHEVRASAVASMEHWSRVLADLSPAELAVPCGHPRGIPYTAGAILGRLPGHDENHRAQITDIIRRINGS